MKKTNFDKYLEEQLKDPEFAARFEGHSLSTLRRVAKALQARVRVTFEPEKKEAGMSVDEETVPYSCGDENAKQQVQQGS